MYSIGKYNIILNNTQNSQIRNRFGFRDGSLSVMVQSSMFESETLCAICTDSAISGDKKSDIILIVELPSIHSVGVCEPGGKNAVFIVAKQKILNMFILGLLALSSLAPATQLLYTDNNETLFTISLWRRLYPKPRLLAKVQTTRDCSKAEI